MEIKEILSKVDHTYLKQTATWQDIKATCDEGIAFSVASVCIPPSFVKDAKEYVGDRLRICTVTGFPNGYATCASKCFESAEAVKNGADEIDTVINIGDLKSKNYDKIKAELTAIKESIDKRVLKVIIETCLLTDEEKIRMCEIVTESGADFIKTSTGFSTSGATREDIILFSKQHSYHLVNNPHLMMFSVNLCILPCNVNCLFNFFFICHILLQLKYFFYFLMF